MKNVAAVLLQPCTENHWILVEYIQKPRNRTNRKRIPAPKQKTKKLKTLRKEARAREGKVVQEVLRSRDVVLATCVGAATHSLREEEFDLVVIDEAAQVCVRARVPAAGDNLCILDLLCIKYYLLVYSVIAFVTHAAR